uniref:NADPH oxidoreductase n=1 Tax=Solanum tuberosum TaxID=4113 RepID=M1AX48_SOLTU
MDIHRFRSPYSDPRASPEFGAANPWQNYSGNATYQASNPYDYCNTGYGAYYSGCQQHFDQQYHLYSFNSSLEHPRQAPSFQPASYPYQPSEFARTSSNIWYAGVVRKEAAAMGFGSDPRMVGTNYRFEHPNPALSCQYQQSPINTSTVWLSPEDPLMEKVIPTVINSNVSFSEEGPGSTQVVGSCNAVILEAVISPSVVTKVHQPLLTNYYHISKFGDNDTIPSQKVRVPVTLKVAVPNNKDNCKMNLDLEVELGENGIDKEEEEFSRSPSSLDVNAHKVFDESSLRTCETYVDVPSQTIDVSQSFIELETTTKSITESVVIFDQTSYDTTATFNGYPPTYYELQVKNLESKCFFTDFVNPYQVRALEILAFSSDMVVYNKEDNPMKLALVDSVYPTKEGKTCVLNAVKESNQFLVINSPSIEEKMVTAVEYFLNLSQLKKKEERRRQKDQWEEMPTCDVVGYFDKLNCIGNEDSVTTASFSEEKGKIVAALADEECAEFHLGLKFALGLFIRCNIPTTGECPAAFEKHFTTYRGCSFLKIRIRYLGRSSISQEMLLRGYPLQKKIEFPMSSNNFSFSLVNCCSALLLSGVDTNSALAHAAATVIKRPEAIHVPGSAKVSAIQVLEKYLKRQGFLMVDCGCVTCSWKSVNLDESIVSTKLENDNVVIVVLTGKRNLEEYVQFSRRANFPASLPLTFADALTNIVDQIEIRAHIFGDCLHFPFDPGDCFHLCSCLLRCFLEVKEVLKEGVLIRFGNRALVGQIISWNFPIFMALSIYYNTILNILGIGKSRLYNSYFERLGQGGMSIANNLQWWLTRDTISLLAIFSTQLTTHLLDDLFASWSHLYHPLDIIFSQDHSHNGCSLKEKKYSCLVDWKGKLRELNYSLKFINKLGNAIIVDRDQIQLVSILHGGNIASDALIQFWHGLAMKMILELKDGLLQLGSILRLNCCTFSFQCCLFYMVHSTCPWRNYTRVIHSLGSWQGSRKTG